METWDPKRLEQNVLAATDETIGLMVGLMTFGAATVEAGRYGVSSTIDFAPVMEDEEEGSEPEPIIWPMPQYPKNLGAIALGEDGLVHADDRQFAIAA